MEEVRKIVSLALEKRNAAGIKVRQPLGKLTVASSQHLGDKYLELIKDEVNVKEVVSAPTLSVGGPTESVGRDTLELDTNITPELKEEGEVRDFIRAVQELRKEKNLTPDQKIILEVETTEERRAFLEKNKNEIFKPTNVSEFVFKLSEGEMKIEIK
jgi:isoleucyl-tRNA synthetase